MYDSLVGLLQIRRAILFFPLCATVGKLVARDSLHWFVHVELTALVQWLMFAIFIAGMLNHRHAFCALFWEIGLLPFTSCLYKAISIVGERIIFPL